MRIPKSLKFFCTFLMSLMLSNVPAVALAEGQMISTSSFVSSLNRGQAEQRVQDFLTDAKVRQQLIDRGVSPDEVSQRVASLSDAELKQLSGQVEQARAGGDILITILVVVLIIFLIKRI